MDRSTNQVGIPTDDDLKLTLMRTARLHHDFLTVVITILRVVLVLGGIVVAIRIADGLAG